MSKCFIYNMKNQKEVVEIPITTYEEFKEEPQRFFPSWDSEINISSQTKYDYPYVTKEGVRNMEREERILINGEIELLLDGEYISKGEILAVPKPTSMYKPIWNKISNTWEEGATTHDIDKELEILLDEYIELVDKKDNYEKFEFPTDSIYMKMGENTSRRIELIEIRDSL